MTDNKRFSLIVSVPGAVPSIGVARDERIPEAVKNMSAGYTPGVPRLGIPAIQSSDASIGVTNPGYRPGELAQEQPCDADDDAVAGDVKQP